MTTAAISVTRQLVHALLAGAPVPLHRWLPGNVDDLPAIVVGRPSLTEGTSAALASITVPVHALGRTVRDDEAQAELDSLADLLVARLWKPPQTEGVSLGLTSCTPGVIEIAGVDVPAYTATVAATTAYCP